MLAAHGLTSNASSWGLVAKALARRGHADGGRPARPRPQQRPPRPVTASPRTPTTSPRCSTHLGAEHVVVAGHSMGGFVATMFAVRHAGEGPGAGARRRRVAVRGPARRRRRRGASPRSSAPPWQRLDMTFADRGEYRAFWEQHPSFAHIWSAEVEAHIQHDLIGEPPEMRSSCSKDAITFDDGAELFADGGGARRDRPVRRPLTLLWAPRGHGRPGPARALPRGAHRRGPEPNWSRKRTTSRSCSASPARAGSPRAIRKACSLAPGRRT